jgi:hypothetical protein
MTPHPDAKCSGALTGKDYFTARKHPQCEGCARLFGAYERDAPEFWIKPPLGLLADEDELCSMRRSM